MQTKKMLKIVHLGQKRIPSREGGVEVVVEQLATRMVKKGHYVTCYNRGGHHVSGKQYNVTRLRDYQGVKLKQVLTIDVKGIAAMSSSFFGALCAAFGEYDIVHFHAEGPAFMCWLPRLMGKKVIVTIHGLDWQRAKWGKFASAYIMAGERAAIKYADEVIVLSRGVQEYFEERYGRRPIYIPNGVTSVSPVAACKIKEKWNLEKDSYILYLGRLVPEKGIHYLIEAYKRTNTNKKLVIAGGSSDTDAYMEKIQAMANDNVIFTGFQEGKILEELYSNAYVYCLPSDLEGMPLSLLEAMSYGNCCLVSDIEECTAVVGDKAEIFSKADVNDLYLKLTKLLEDETLVKKYKEEASNYICEKYNWDDVVEKTLELYRG